MNNFDEKLPLPLIEDANSFSSHLKKNERVEQRATVKPTMKPFAARRSMTRRNRKKAKNKITKLLRK